MIKKLLNNQNLSRLLLTVLLLGGGFFSGMVTAGGVALADQRANSEIGIIRTVQIEAEVVRLQDIFTGLGDSRYRERIVLESPAPGESITLPAEWLFRLARSYRVDWKPISRFDEVEVIRASRLVSEKELKGYINQSIKDSLGVEDVSYSVRLDNGSQELHLPANMLGELVFKQMQYNQNTGRFSTLVIVSDELATKARKTFPLRGYAHRLVDLPVLARDITKGDIIKKKDITYKEYRHNNLPRDAVILVREIEGMAARTRIQKNSVIKLNQVEKPLLVRNKNLVLVELVTKKMVMRLRAQALEDGHFGEVIRVKNLKSKKVFEVEVVAAKKTRLIVTDHSNLAVAQ